MNKEKAKFLLRLSPELKAQLMALAKKEHRSLNAQIEHMLGRAVQKKKVSRPPKVFGGK